MQPGWDHAQAAPQVALTRLHNVWSLEERPLTSSRIKTIEISEVV